MWHALRMPDGTYAELDLQSCTVGVCLLAGIESGHDEIWRYDGGRHSVVATSHPSGGSGITAISCWGSASCVVADVSRTSQPRFFVTSDGGRSWVDDHVLDTIPRSARYLGIEQLRCWSASACILANSYEDPANSHGPSENANSEVVLMGPKGVVGEQNFDQPSLAGLTCRSRSLCILVTQDNDYAGYWLQQHLYVSTDGGKHWIYKRSQLGKTMMLAPNPSGENSYDMSCAASGCVAVASMRSKDWVLLRWDDFKWSMVELTRGSAAFGNVACGDRRCAAVGDWTAVLLKP